MASIFDLLGGMSPEQNQGLLAAAAQVLRNSGPGRPYTLGQGLGDAIGAYQGYGEHQKKQKMLEQRFAQEQELTDFAIRDKKSDYEAQERARAQADRIAKRLSGIPSADAAPAAPEYMASAMPGAEGSPKIGGPDWLQAYQQQNGLELRPSAGGKPANQTDAYVQRLVSMAQVYAEEGNLEGANKLYEQAAKLRPEFDTTPRVANDANGKPYQYLVGKRGEIQRIEGALPRDELEFRDGGDGIYGLDKFTGERRSKLAKGVDPSTIYSANAAAARAAASTPAAKPLPVGALKMQEDGLEKLTTATGINSQLSAIRGQIADGKLSFGPVSNLMNQGLNAAGISTEGSRNFANFRVTLEKLRNDSLRLNTGVQTDGDAQREWNALFQNINDTKWVAQRLEAIEGINARGAELQKLRIDGVRGNYGHAPLDYSPYEQAGGQVSKQSRPAAGGAKVATLADIAETARKSGRSTAEVTAALRAKGYTIGGQ